MKLMISCLFHLVTGPAIISALRLNPQVSISLPKDMAEVLYDSFIAPVPKGLVEALRNVPFPDSLRGKNLIIIGDSNDRFTTTALCMTYGTGYNPVRDMEGDTENSKITGNDGTSMGSCDLDKYNASVRFVRHNGALSAEPHLPFHLFSCGNAQRGKGDLKRADGTAVTSVTDLAKFYWPTFFKTMPKRPINLMMQSSVYDSVLAYEFLRDHRRPITIAQDGLEEQGWIAHEEGIAAWRWIEHASTFVSAVKDSLQGENVEHIVWRTNSNCPGNHEKNAARATLIKTASEMQAQVVRAAIAEKQEAWTRVELLDFAKLFDSQGRCNGVHYEAPGYKAIIEDLFRILTQDSEGGGIKLKNDFERIRLDEHV